jgi:hypothetical protein
VCNYNYDDDRIRYECCIQFRDVDLVDVVLRGIIIQVYLLSVIILYAELIVASASE